MTILIRRVKPTDRDEILRLKTTEFGNYTFAYTHTLEAHMNDRMYVAEIDNIVVGFIGYEILIEPPTNLQDMHLEPFMIKYAEYTNNFNKVCFMHTCIISNKYRKLGLGRILFKYAIQATMDHVNYYIADLVCYSNNDIPFKNIISDYSFTFIDRIDNAWSDFFDGYDIICPHCGYGISCKCKADMYIYDVAEKYNKLIDELDIIQIKIDAKNYTVIYE